MNITILIGRIATDLELKQTTSGGVYTAFNLAVSRHKKEDGTQDADFIRCKAFGKTAELINQYMHKGSRMGVIGAIQTGSYQNNEGQTIYTTDVLVNRCEFLDTKSKQQQDTPTTQSSTPQATNFQNVNNYNPQQQSTPQASSSGFYGVGQQTYDQMFSNNETLDISTDDLPF
ncbi:single-stranded DNA-binding protein [Allobaculum stercoricanis]|uniref:single-stranded DNA-binding protein n=1 Tax=Allobaculum stercoricanis TaxID=174709 RepID=UPI0029424E65|nr:single-stranded DNA-binding protein [Allobaculum stercoricanis]